MQTMILTFLIEELMEASKNGATLVRIDGTFLTNEPLTPRGEIIT